MSTGQASYRRVTEKEEIKQSHHLPDSRKLCGHLDEWLAQGFAAGDQGLVHPASPLLYVNAAGELCAVVMLTGNGSMEQVIAELHAEKHGASGVVSAVSPGSSAAAVDGADSTADSTDWRTLEAAYFLIICTSNTASSDALVGTMLHELLPLHSKAPFYFSATPARFRPWIESLANQHDAELEWSASDQWECAPGCFVETDKPEFRAALEECTRLYDRAATGRADLPAADASLASAACATGEQTDGVVAAPVAHLEIAPLRLEHVDLVVSNWPWASPSAPAMVRHLISNYTTRCVYVDGTPVSWSLEQAYGAMGMLHTQPTHRSRGYGPLCVEAMYRALRAAHPQRPTVWAVITNGNTASERVFTRRGFKSQNQCLWVMWIPRRR